MKASVSCALALACLLLPGAALAHGSARAAPLTRSTRAPASDSTAASRTRIADAGAHQSTTAASRTRTGRALTSSSTAAFQAHMSHELALAGPFSGGLVYDMTTKQTLFGERSEDLRAPASVEKLYTATALLERLGPTARLETTVLGSGHLGLEGAWEGNLYLHGGGDPTLGTTSFIRSHYGGVGTSISTLVEQLVRVDGIHSVTGTVEGDESYFDSLRGEPSSGYRPDPFLEGTLSALAFNRGARGSYRGPHAPAAFAAHELLRALKAAGVSVLGGSGAASAPPGAARLAAAPSPTVAQLLGLTLPPSDNFFAETLLKDLGARLAGAGSTAAGARVVVETLAALGLHPRVVDASGLSRADQTSPLQVVTLLGALAPTTLGTILRADMAVVGRSGTLAERMRGTAAAGRCQGKTGTLTGVSNLVGYCQAVNGQYIAFAFFNDGISIEAAHVLQDNMTITLAGY